MEDIAVTVDGTINKIKHYLISHYGKIESEATNEEFYRALCRSLREQIMINWTATLQTMHTQKVKTLFYLSMEYLPGKMMGNNITNVGLWNLVHKVLEKTNRSLSDLIACDVDPGLGNGGLGRLASCFLDSLATQKYPAFGYGLRYQYGIFEQEIWQGQQIEKPDCWLLNEYPWEVRKDAHAHNVFFSGKMIPAINRHGDEVFNLENFEEVRAIAYDIPIVGYTQDDKHNVLSLRLWSTKESPRNFELQRYNAGQLGPAGENTSLTDVLYPNDNNETGKRIRLKQEFLLVSASLQDIITYHLHNNDDISSFKDKVQIQINDTHAALIIAELPRKLITNYDVSFDEAWEITQSCCNYTNHTILKESLEEWNENRIAALLPRQYRMIQKLNQRFCQEIRQRFVQDEDKLRRMSFIENGQIKMSHLAIYGSKQVNGVAKLHGEILKNDLFKDFADMYPEKFIHITNGITPRRWLMNCNFHLAHFISEKIGTEWLEDLTKITKLKEFAKDNATQQGILNIKKMNKEKFFDFLQKENPLRDAKGKIIGHSPVLDTDCLVDVQIKRIHEYKRQLLLALHTIMLMHEIQKDPSSRKLKRLIVIAGKAAPGYVMAKRILHLLSAIADKINNDPKINPYLRMVIVENYNVSKAELIIPAADLSEQISAAGNEASGTGNMKLALNGALTIGTHDGANIEMQEATQDKWWPFAFGAKAEQIKQTPSPNSWEIYLSNDKIQKAVNCLKEGCLARNELEHTSFCAIYNSILDGDKNPHQDRYFIIQDLASYYETQKRVEDLFIQPLAWAETVIHNIASMGIFSSDMVINNYVQSIWKIEKCPMQEDILHRVREEFVQ